MFSSLFLLFANMFYICIIGNWAVSTRSKRVDKVKVKEEKARKVIWQKNECM